MKKTVAAAVLVWSLLPPVLFAGALSSATDDRSIQAAIDQNPGRQIFVPAGDHVIHDALRIGKNGGGLWGPGRIVQDNPRAAIIEVQNAADVQLQGLTLTRATGNEETHAPAVKASHADRLVLADLVVRDNWSDGGAIVVHDSRWIVVRSCTVRNYNRVAIDDRTDTSFLGYAFNCTNGSAINLRNIQGGLVQGNRIIEQRLLPTPEIKKKYDLGRIVKKAAKKGALISQESWDSNYVNIWRQGAAIVVNSGETTDFVQILGNYIENTQQGIDTHADHVILANNIIVDAGHGIKAVHGSRNVLIVGNQLARNDLFAIGLMQGTNSHVAGATVESHGVKRVQPMANIDGYSIVANNIISDFGYGMTAWIWGSGHSIGPAPIQLGGHALPETPVLRDVLVLGNVVYDPGRDQILVDGKPRSEPPRYHYAIKVEPGSSAPQRIGFADNLIDPGIDGIATVDLTPPSPLR